jgi:DNA-3-methyladenine glycosylase
MGGPPGFAYVYFTYGMHYCMNAVCEPSGTSAAVLIRAGRVTAGEQLAQRRRRRGADAPDRDLARGPARLCQALAVTRAENGLDLCDPASPLRLRSASRPRVGHLEERNGEQAPARISVGPRVGVTAAMDVPLRFWLTGDPTVSAYRLHKPRPR